LRDREAAIARAISVAEIGGPFRVEGAVNGPHEMLDPESRDNVLDLTGPNGHESVVLSADGVVVGWLVQGQ